MTGRSLGEPKTEAERAEYDALPSAKEKLRWKFDHMSSDDAAEFWERLSAMSASIPEDDDGFDVESEESWTGERGWKRSWVP